MSDGLVSVVRGERCRLAYRAMYSARTCGELQCLHVLWVRLAGGADALRLCEHVLHLPG
jgi:hypothetical protein